MSADAPVLNEILRTRTDVDDVVRRLSRHVPGQVEGRFLQVSMWWFEPARTLPQANLARSWSSIIARHAGYTPGQMWDYLCRELIGTAEVVNPFTGEAQEVAMSSTTLRDRGAYKLFVDGIERLAREHYDIQLPAPNDPAAWAAFRSISRVRTERELS